MSMFNESLLSQLEEVQIDDLPNENIDYLYQLIKGQNEIIKNQQTQIEQSRKDSREAKLFSIASLTVAVIGALVTIALGLYQVQFQEKVPRSEAIPEITTK